MIDVAQDAGVSRATVSLVMRNSPLVAETTREKVYRSIQKLNYVYNRNAASLRKSATETIGLIITHITNPFFSEMVLGVEDVLDAAGFQLLLTNTRENPDKERRILQNFIEQRVDGIIMCPAYDSDRNFLESLKDVRIPFVLVARYYQDYDHDYVGTDNVNGAMKATRHLLDEGHTRVAFIGGPEHSSAREERVQGFAYILNQQGYELEAGLNIPTDVSRDGGYRGLEETITRYPPPTAALCYNDIVATGVIQALQARGLTPGKDFSVIGFDDIALASLMRPAISTVSVNPPGIGRAAAERLLKKIQGEEQVSHRIFLGNSLTLRETTKPV